MTLATLLLIPLLAGYAFSVTWAGSRYQCAREDGYRLYFRAAFYGCFLFASSIFIYLYLVTISLNPIAFVNGIFSDVFIYFKKSDQTAQLVYLDISTITLVLGLFLGHVLNFIPRSKRFFLNVAIKNDDFEKLILRSIKKIMPLSITMSNGKIYVGYAIRGTDPGAKMTELRILPLLSGFRDSQTGIVAFTTKYDEIYEDIAAAQNSESESKFDHLDSGDFEIVLPVSEIQSSNLFDIDVYKKFQEKISVDE